MIRLSLVVLGCWLAACSAVSHGQSTPLPRAQRTVPCASAASVAGWRAPEVYAGDTRVAFDDMISTLETARIVLLGETHDRYDHHLTQLEIVCRLQRSGRPIALGLEAFQQPFQPALDDYVAGRIDETGLLRNTQYFSRWRYDFRHYAPMLRFARARGIDLVALNVPAEITRKVADGGLESLTPGEHARVPREIDRSNAEYRDRLRGVFEQHPGDADRRFEHFLEVQLLWDEGMAQAAARYLSRHPGSRMVIIAGTGHIEFGDGIPDRIERRTGADAVTVLPRAGDLPGVGSADFRLDTGPIELPPPGLLGVYLEDSPDGIEVDGFTDDSAAEAVGMKRGDRLESVDDHPVSTFADVKIAMLEKRPGDVVPVVVRRGGTGDPPPVQRVQRFRVTLR